MDNEDLINRLEELRLFIIKLKDELNLSGVQRTAGLLNAMGSDCAFYRKSLELFYRKDYEKLKQLINEIHGQMNNE